MQMIPTVTDGPPGVDGGTGVVVVVGRERRAWTGPLLPPQPARTEAAATTATAALRAAVAAAR